MRISIFGLGYVGTVCAAALARSGFEVLGVDVNETKNAQINEGRSPIVEPGLEELIGEAVGAKRLSATSDHEQAVVSSELSLICVGTPAAATEAWTRATSRTSRARSAVTCASATGGTRSWSAAPSSRDHAGPRSPLLESVGHGCGVTSGSPTTRSSCARAAAIDDFIDPP